MKALAAALVLGLGIFASHSADAQQPVYQSGVVVQSTPIYSSYAVPTHNYSAPVYSTSSSYSRSRPGLFGRLIELERRKNAWLRRTFLGR